MSKEESLFDIEEEDIFDDESEQSQSLIFSANDIHFAIPALAVKEMLPIQKVVHIPDTPPWVRGVINVRQETFVLIDFRKRVGMDSVLEENSELINELQEREKEHVNWIEDLKSAVHEDHEFHGEVDPHKCKFGRWYDSYEAPNATAALELKKFDFPHQMIHATAEKALTLKENGQMEEAVSLIEKRESTELARMIKLFDSFRKHIREEQKEVIILTEWEGHKFSIAVDQVESVEILEADENIALKNLQQENESFSRHAQIARRGEEGEIVYLIDPTWIAQGTEQLVLD